MSLMNAIQDLAHQELAPSQDLKVLLFESEDMKSIDTATHHRFVTISTPLFGQALYDACALHDFIIDGTNDAHFSLELNDWALMLDKPIVFINAKRQDGHPFVKYGQTRACLRCFWSNELRMIATPNPSEGTHPAGTNSHAQKLQLIHTLIQSGLQDLEKRSTKELKVPSCTHTLSHYDVLSQHKKYPHLVRSTNLERFEIIDIREHSERKLKVLENRDYLTVPINAVLQNPTHYIHSQKKTVLVCEQGQRSSLAAQHLQNQGFSKVFALEHLGGKNSYAHMPFC